MRLPRNLIYHTAAASHRHKSWWMSCLRPTTPWIFNICLRFPCMSGPKVVIGLDSFGSMNPYVCHCAGWIIPLYIILWLLRSQLWISGQPHPPWWLQCTLGGPRGGVPWQSLTLKVRLTHAVVDQRCGLESLWFGVNLSQCFPIWWLAIWLDRKKWLETRLGFGSERLVTWLDLRYDGPNDFFVHFMLSV